MQAVPSLVWASTVVAVGAVRLDLRQSTTDATTSNSRLTSSKKRIASLFEKPRLASSAGFHTTSNTSFGCDPPMPFDSVHPTENDENIRPGSPTSPPTPFSAVPPKFVNRRISWGRHSESGPSRTIPESRRNSIAITSHNTTWARRLSLRPPRQYDNPRQSIGPDTFTQLEVDVLTEPSPRPYPGTLPPQFLPNKLVKRSSTTAPTGTYRSVSQHKAPTLRRPATSHQRSSTLFQQFQAQESTHNMQQAPKFSFDQTSRLSNLFTRPRANTVELSREEFTREQAPEGRRSPFFPFRSKRSSLRLRPEDAYELSPTKNDTHSSHSHLNIPPRPATAMAAPVSMKHRLIGIATAGARAKSTAHRSQNDSLNAIDDGNLPSHNPHPRRSLSMPLSSSDTWASSSKSESLYRGASNLTVSTDDGPRHTPTTTIFAPRSDDQSDVPPLATPRSPPTRQTSVFRVPEPSTPTTVPPISCRSGPHTDPSTDEVSPYPTSPAEVSSTAGSVCSPLRAPPVRQRSRQVSDEVSSMVTDSDVELPNLTSGGEDDTDNQSDTMYDSIQISARATRSQPGDFSTDSIFDESPVVAQAKRLSIQHVYGTGWDKGMMAQDEDDALPTPIRVSNVLTAGTAFALPNLRRRLDDMDCDTSSDLATPSRAFFHMPLDDIDDDWTRDDDTSLFDAHEIPPVANLTSRQFDPSFPATLASLVGFRSHTHLDDAGLPPPQRPRSNIFDWVEPLSHDKHDASVHSRPMTVHGKQQQLDLRSGRLASRKGPAPAHVRSQSVPVVPDPADSSKSAPKYGLWGLANKAGAEDWDDDFEFEESPAEDDGQAKSPTTLPMVVPPSIQASQPTVKAHSGQIREFSLLVNDLKRLYRHGKDLSIIAGANAARWKEADDIIALASPDDDLLGGEEELALSTDDPMSSMIAEGFDPAALDHPIRGIEETVPDMALTAVVKERPTTRRPSVFMTDDDVFGVGWPSTADQQHKAERVAAAAPEVSRPNSQRESAAIASVIEAMQQRSASTPIRASSPFKTSDRLFFDTNSLQELVKKASKLRDELADIVRRAEFLTQTPLGTPRRERLMSTTRVTSNGSPAFTRVFTDPAASSPPRPLPKTHSSSTVLTRSSVEHESPRMMIMTVN